MPTIRLTLAYEGTDFVGWQRQRNGLSVQELLEAALHKVTGQAVACRAAGRTDSGVHALGQVVTFRLGAAADAATPPATADAETTPATAATSTLTADATNAPATTDAAAAAPTAPATAATATSTLTARGAQAPPPPERPVSLRALVHGTNYHLPPAIRVLDAQVAPDEFDARFSASGKLYRYQLWNAPTESPLHARTHWHIIARLDLEAMQAAAQVLIGHHDFRAFRAASCERLTTDRTVRRIAISAQGPYPAPVHIDVEATAFLRNMVRIIAGTLVYVGRGRLSAADVAALLRSGDRTRAGPTAPAHGLILWRVDYGPRDGV
ncbi:MAG TPA: tRNA pseudouridine synthase A [Pseudomonadota bacterium]|nr:tRNA pseudouridine synthase A [Pseudomonadota bacterium]